jgi:hypothetical protein
MEAQKKNLSGRLHAATTCSPLQRRLFVFFSQALSGKNAAELSGELAFQFDPGSIAGSKMIARRLAWLRV